MPQAIFLPYLFPTFLEKVGQKAQKPMQRAGLPQFPMASASPTRLGGKEERGKKEEGRNDFVVDRRLSAKCFNRRFSRPRPPRVGGNSFQSKITSISQLFLTHSSVVPLEHEF